MNAELNESQLNHVSYRIFRSVLEVIRDLTPMNTGSLRKYTDNVPRLLTSDAVLTRLVRQISQKYGKNPNLTPEWVRDFLSRRVSEYFAYVDAVDLLQKSSSQKPEFSDIEVSNPLTTYHILSRMPNGHELIPLVSSMYFREIESEMNVCGLLVVAQNSQALASGMLASKISDPLAKLKEKSFALESPQCYKRRLYRSISFVARPQTFICVPRGLTHECSRGVLKAGFDHQLVGAVTQHILFVLASEDLIPKHFGMIDE